MWGLDIGGSRSGSAVVACWPLTGRAEALLALPERPDLPDRQKRDSAPPGLYKRAWAKGHLMLAGRRSPDVRALVTEAVARFGEPTGIACDSWKQDQLADALEDIGIAPEISLRRMGWHHSGEDAEALRFLIGEDRFHPVRTAVWDWQTSRCATRSDHVANVRLEKTQGDDMAVATPLVAGLVRREGERLAEPPALLVVDFG